MSIYQTPHTMKVKAIALERSNAHKLKKFFFTSLFMMALLVFSNQARADTCWMQLPYVEVYNGGTQNSADLGCLVDWTGVYYTRTFSTSDCSYVDWIGNAECRTRAAAVEPARAGEPPRAAVSAIPEGETDHSLVDSEGFEVPDGIVDSPDGVEDRAGEVDVSTATEESRTEWAWGGATTQTVTTTVESRGLSTVDAGGDTTQQVGTTEQVFETRNDWMGGSDTTTTVVTQDEDGTTTSTSYGYSSDIDPYYYSSTVGGAGVSCYDAGWGDGTQECIDEYGTISYIYTTLDGDESDWVDTFPGDSPVLYDSMTMDGAGAYDPATMGGAGVSCYDAGWGDGTQECIDEYGTISYIYTTLDGDESDWVDTFPGDSPVLYDSMTMGGAGAYDPATMGGAGAYDPTTMGGAGAYDPTTMGGVGAYDPTTMGGVGAYDPATMDGAGAYDPTTMGGAGAYDPTTIGGAGAYDPTTMGGAGAYDPTTMGGAGVSCYDAGWGDGTQECIDEYGTISYIYTTLDGDESDWVDSTYSTVPAAAPVVTVGMPTATSSEGDLSQDDGNTITTADGTELTRVLRQDSEGSTETVYQDARGEIFTRSSDGSGFVSEESSTEYRYDNQLAVSRALRTAVGGADLGNVFTGTSAGVPDVDSSFDHSFSRPDGTTGRVIDGRIFEYDSMMLAYYEDGDRSNPFFDMGGGTISSSAVGPYDVMETITFPADSVSLDYVNGGLLQRARDGSQTFYTGDCSGGLGSDACNSASVQTDSEGRMYADNGDTRQYMSSGNEAHYLNKDIDGLFVLTGTGMDAYGTYYDHGVYKEGRDPITGLTYFENISTGETVYPDPVTGQYPVPFDAVTSTRVLVDASGTEWAVIENSDGTTSYFDPITGNELFYDYVTGTLTGYTMDASDPMGGVISIDLADVAEREYIDDARYLVQETDLETGETTYRLVDSNTGVGVLVDYDASTGQFSSCSAEGECYTYNEHELGNILAVADDAGFDPLLSITDDGNLIAPTGEELPDGTTFDPGTGLYSVGGNSWSPDDDIPDNVWGPSDDGETYAMSDDGAPVDGGLEGDGPGLDSEGYPAGPRAPFPPDGTHGDYAWDPTSGQWVMADGSNPGDNGLVWDPETRTWGPMRGLAGSGEGRCAWVYLNSQVAEQVAGSGSLAGYDGPINAIIYDSATGLITTTDNDG